MNMKLAISNIAWTNEEEADVAAKLQELGVRYIEIAPTKIWSDPTKATIEQINEYIEWWKKYDIEIVAFQSMLFARPDLKMFESSELRDETRQYLADFLRLAGDMGASRLVLDRRRIGSEAECRQKRQMILPIAFSLSLVMSLNNIIRCFVSSQMLLNITVII